tara:strand:- start:167 stop:517 length:351 start_codon:yes stop_codon:yes gene_type:complete
MRTFREFVSLCEQTYDKEMGQTIKKIGTGVKVGAERKKTAPEKRRMKAAGGGKMVPAKDYKARKDIGQQRKAETRVQQPTKERGSAKLDPRAAQERLLWREEQRRLVLKHQQHHNC